MNTMEEPSLVWLEKDVWASLAIEELENNF